MSDSNSERSTDSKLEKLISSVVSRMDRIEAALANDSGAPRRDAPSVEETLATFVGLLTLLREKSLHIDERLEFIEQSFKKLELEVTSSREELRTNTAGLLNSLSFDQDALELKNLAGEIKNAQAETRLWVEKISVETSNGLNHLDGRLVSGLNRLFNEELPTLGGEGHAAYSALTQLRAQTVDKKKWKKVRNERYQPAEASRFDDYLASAREDFPTVFDHWKERLDATLAAFNITMVGNAAEQGDIYSNIFKNFLEVHLSGRVLDVGCGVFGKPYYLMDYPSNLISAIEPLEFPIPSDFECVRGISEYLPWPDESFSTVLSATSLDHSLSLKKSLAEMRRVMCKNGRLVLWVGSIPGSLAFEPDSPDFVPADEFHLFHFDKEWLEPLLEEEWTLLDRIELKRASFSHIIYALQKK